MKKIVCQENVILRAQIKRILKGKNGKGRSKKTSALLRERQGFLTTIQAYLADEHFRDYIIAEYNVFNEVVHGIDEFYPEQSLIVHYKRCTTGTANKDLSSIKLDPRIRPRFLVYHFTEKCNLSARLLH